MAAGADVRALGAAVTVALCGRWDHKPPCPLAPHHSQPRWVNHEVHLRVVFATEPAHETDVRERIDQALAREELHGPQGVTRWRVLRTRPGELSTEDSHHVYYLLRR